MFTQCPQCNAIFQVTASQLKAAGGDVRCGQCLSVFNALDHLSEQVPHAPETETTNELAHDAHQYRDWSGETPGATTQGSAQTHEPATPQTLSGTDDDIDVFSDEVIAEVSSSNIPAVEIERFEEFLASRRLPDETDAPATEDTPPSDDFSAKHRSPDETAQPTEDVFPDRPAEESLPTEDSVPGAINAQPEVSDAPGTSDIEASPPLSPDTTGNSAEGTNFADIDSATADRNTEISIEDDEFAELDAYLNGPDEAAPANAAETSEKATTDDDAIIIEDTDLDPMTSTDYTDSPATASAQSADATATDTTTSAEKPDAAPTDEPQTIHIPTLILDDLQAAKAEQLRPSSTPWVIGSLVLMLTLVLQVVYHSRDELAKDANLRPWLIQMCEVAGCTLSQPYDIQQIEIIGRDVRSHPTARKALVVSTTLINNASFVQPFPLLTMTFSDINGTKIAQRRFTPREYLNNDVDLAAGMTPDMPVRIELELVDPGKAAVNYEFRAEADPRRTRPLT